MRPGSPDLGSPHSGEIEWNPDLSRTDGEASAVDDLAGLLRCIPIGAIAPGKVVEHDFVISHRFARRPFPKFLKSHPFFLPVLARRIASAIDATVNPSAAPRIDQVSRGSQKRQSIGANQ
jgi:hypothetical protein